MCPATRAAPYSTGPRARATRLRPKSVCADRSKETFAKKGVIGGSKYWQRLRIENVLAAGYSAKRQTGTLARGYGRGYLRVMRQIEKPQARQRQPVSGWGGQPQQQALVDRPRELRDVQTMVRTATGAIGRGAGRSYGDAAIADHVISCLPMRRLLAFDGSTGTLLAQGGITLDAIIRFVLPRGWFLPVTPGTRFPTLAGCVAADVHGKNHHAVGSLASFVEALELVLADGSLVTCSPQHQPEIFWATLGGMGLTGFIYSVRLRLQPVRSAWIQNLSVRTNNLADSCKVLLETQQDYPYSVAWIDTLSPKHLGRGLVALGAHAEDDRLAPLHQPPGLSVPAMPCNVVTGVGQRLFNTLYYRRQFRRRSDALIHYAPYFYPLDALGGWNRLYGRRGFLQFQFAIPQTDADTVMRTVLARLHRAGPCALAVLKTFGDHPAGPLGFPLPGFTLALDYARTTAIETAVRDASDDIIAAGGRVYLAKDSVITSDQLDAMYPRLDEFCRLRRQLDPHGHFRSLQSDRLGLS